MVKSACENAIAIDVAKPLGQFFSKTVQNLAENPRASVLLMDPVTYDQYRLAIVYERTERRGPVFERLRDSIAEEA